MSKFSLKIILVAVVSAIFLMGGVFVYPSSSFSASPGVELSTTAQSIKSGDLFTVNIYVDPGGAAIDTARVSMTYPAQTVAIITFTEGRMFPQKSLMSGYDNEKGVFSWGEYTSGDGVTAKGLFGSVTVMALKDGVARFQVATTSHLLSGGEEKIVRYGSVSVVIGGDSASTITPSTAPPPVVASPGTPPRLEQAPVSNTQAPVTQNPQQSTPVLSSSDQNAVVNVKSTGAPYSPVITSTTHADQDAWYVNNNPEFTVGLLPGTTGINVIADKYPLTDPGTRPDVLRKTFVYPNVGDGVWYFHAKLKNSFGWGDTAHYKFQIDTEPPSDLAVEEADSEPGKAAFAIHASDAISGIDHFMVSLDDEGWQPWSGVSGTYTATSLAPGLHAIKVQAFDRAGNKKELSRSFEIQPQPLGLEMMSPSNIAASVPPARNKPAIVLAIEILWIISQLLVFALLVKLLSRFLPVKQSKSPLFAWLFPRKKVKKTNSKAPRRWG